MIRNCEVKTRIFTTKDRTLFSLKIALNSKDDVLGMESDTWMTADELQALGYQIEVALEEAAK